jgi:hypothetical protein
VEQQLELTTEAPAQVHMHQGSDMHAMQEHSVTQQ